VDPKRASYGVENLLYAVVQLCVRRSLLQTIGLCADSPSPRVRRAQSAMRK